MGAKAGTTLRSRFNILKSLVRCASCLIASCACLMFARALLRWAWVRKLFPNLEREPFSDLAGMPVNDLITRLILRLAQRLAAARLTGFCTTAVDLAAGPCTTTVEVAMSCKK